MLQKSSPAFQRRVGYWFSVCALLAALVYPFSASAIVGGRVDANASDSPWAGVGSLSVKGGTYTATAIGSRFILTAAHVVDGVSANNVNFNLNIGGNLTQSIKASSIHVFPAYHGFTPSSADGLVHNDLAVIELSSDLPTGVPIYTLLTGIPVTPPTITMVGYGMSGDGENGATIPGSASVKRIGDNQVDKLFRGPNGKADMFMFDFDGPTPATKLTGDSALTHKSQLATGDSGSPSFVQNNGVWQILGVNTFVAPKVAGADKSKYGALGGGTLASAYSDWIQGIITEPHEASQVSLEDNGTTPAPKVSAGMLFTGIVLSVGAMLFWIQRRRRITR